MSQNPTAPISMTDIKLRRTKTFPPAAQTTSIYMTQAEADEKIRIFNASRQTYIDKLNIEKQELKSSLSLSPTELKVYYFIGRLNPPHLGHIETLRNLINTAKSNGELFQVVILLGSGPNGGARTLNDPLPFDLKKTVVIDLLKQNGVLDINQLEQSQKVIIEEMGRAASQISDIIKKIIEINETIIDIETVRFSGDKDEDMEKLSWIEKSLSNSLSPLVITTAVVGITAVENEDFTTALSATAVRNNALECYLSELKNTEKRRERDTGFELFESEYGKIYKTNTRSIYDAIIEQAKNFSPEEIQKYIDYKILPGVQKKTGRKKGGSKHGRHKLTKRRKHKLTKRRKSKRVTKNRKSKRRRY